MNKRAPLIAAGVSLVLVVLTFFFLVKPKMSEVSAAQAQLTQKQQDTQTLTQLLATLRDDQANQSKFQQEIASVDQRIPPLLDQQGILTLLRTSAEQSGVDNLTASIGSPTLSATSGVSNVSVSVSIQGRYFTIAEFFYKIETLSRAAKVTQVSLTLGGSSLSGAAVPGTMLAQATVQFYTSDTSAGAGSDPGSQPPASVAPTPAAVPVPSGAP